MELISSVSWEAGVPYLFFQKSCESIRARRRSSKTRWQMANPCLAGTQLCALSALYLWGGSATHSGIGSESKLASEWFGFPVGVHAARIAKKTFLNILKRCLHRLKPVRLYKAPSPNANIGQLGPAVRVKCDLLDGFVAPATHKSLHIYWYILQIHPHWCRLKPSVIDVSIHCIRVCSFKQKCCDTCFDLLPILKRQPVRCWNDGTMQPPTFSTGPARHRKQQWSPGSDSFVILGDCSSFTAQLDQHLWIFLIPALAQSKHEIASLQVSELSQSERVGQSTLFIELSNENTLLDPFLDLG